VSGISPQLRASDPATSAFVTANAGSGKTSTLVNRVARLLLRGADPAAILCVTYTKAAAAEMQRRLFETLGAWAVSPDEELSQRLADLHERTDNLTRARALFAQALETPGGLRIQTLHAFCEKLLKRFPLEAGVAPGFQVLEDQAAREVSAHAREAVARTALQAPGGKVGQAYADFSVELAHRSFLEMFAAFEAQRPAISAYFAACAGQGGYAADVWDACGFEAPGSSEELEAAALAQTDWAGLRDAGRAMLNGSAKSDVANGTALLSLVERGLRGEVSFDLLWRWFCTEKGEPRGKLATKAIDASAAAGLAREQDRLGRACGRIKAARVAEDSVAALELAEAYCDLYEGAKAAQGGLDFADLIQRAHRLLTSPDGAAAWVLYKLDGGIEHVLVDEAQDTAPDQWDIVRALTSEFFAGQGRSETRRTMFAVGDEKQSIYSFQGADPGRFLSEREEYRQLVAGAGEPFTAPSLLQSFRSTPETLEFVDLVFANGDALEALRPDGDMSPVTHEATRPPGFGCVDIWPLEASDVAPETDVWEPLDAEPVTSGNKKLARLIAEQIKDLVSRGEGLLERDNKTLRPVGYGDFLILVRRRGALFHEIIRSLKMTGVPVGGADRLSLSEHIVFHDLIALARFCLFPMDSLTLAALLRSPLCDVDEDGLYDLAHGRASPSLWTVLRARADERVEWRQARDLLEGLRAESKTRPPFEFYARLLNRRDASGRSMRSRIARRLGAEADEALDAFLAEALKAERRGVRDLETFTAEMASVEVEVKREQEDGKGEVRVMTVHGAKGLEAPVVILPDTATKAMVQGAPLLATRRGGFLWSARKADDCEASARARQERIDDMDHESLRLLYVALTRARDRLILCGVEPGKPHFKNDSWWSYIERAFASPAIEHRVRSLETADGRSFRRFGPDPVIVTKRPAEGRVPAGPLPWIVRDAPPEPAVQRYAAPSQVAEASGALAPSPLAAHDGLGRFRRGDLIHRLLQLLPDVEAGGRARAGAAILAKERDLSPPQREEMLRAALAVLEDARFAPVFGPGSRAEAAIAGRSPELPADLPVSGRIDRLVVEPERVLVVDFKTNRPSPDRVEDTDGAYITQMALYAAVLRQVFPGRKVEAALIWTDGPKLMQVPENLMRLALQALPRSG
jgi:ATP-dependent helicase/nuclease subunit A